MTGPGAWTPPGGARRRVRHLETGRLMAPLPGVLPGADMQHVGAGAIVGGTGWGALTAAAIACDGCLPLPLAARRVLRGIHLRPAAGEPENGKATSSSWRSKSGHRHRPRHRCAREACLPRAPRPRWMQCPVPDRRAATAGYLAGAAAADALGLIVTPRLRNSSTSTLALGLPCSARRWVCAAIASSDCRSLAEFCIRGSCCS